MSHLDRIVKVGSVFSLHGFRNKIRVHYDVSEQMFEDAALSKQIFLADGTQLNVKSISFYKNSSIIELHPNQKRDKSYLKQDLLANRKLFGDELLVMDFKNLEVFVREYFFFKKKYGVVVDMPNYGSGDLVEILPEGAKNKDTELYLYNKYNFPKVNFKKNFIIINKKIIN